MGLAYSIEATGLVQMASAIQIVLNNGGTTGPENLYNPYGNRLGSPQNKFMHNPNMDAGMGPLAFASGRDIWHDNASMEVVVRGHEFINDNILIYGAYECEVFDYHNVSGNVTAYVTDVSQFEPDYNHWGVPTGIPVDTNGDIVRISCWDGFVAMLRARPLSNAQADGFVMVQRMPIEVPCGPKGASASQLADIAADSEVGIWDVDCVHNTLSQLREGTGIVGNVRLEIAVYSILCCGFQRGDNDQDSDILVGQTYVPAFYQFPVGTIVSGYYYNADLDYICYRDCQIEINYGVDSPYEFSADGDGLLYFGPLQLTWNAGGVADRGASMTQTGARYISAATTPDPTNPAQYTGIQTLLGSYEWSQGGWTSAGTYDPALTPASSPTTFQYVNPSCANANPTKFYSITSVLSTQSPLVGCAYAGGISDVSTPPITPFIIGGEMMSKDTGNPTYPLAVMGRGPFGSKYIPLLWGVDGQDNGNFMLEDTGTSYSLSGSYISKVELCADGMVTDPTDVFAINTYGVQYTSPTDLPNPTGWGTGGTDYLMGDLVLFCVDNVTHGAATNGEIYCADWTSLWQPFAKTPGTGAFGNNQTALTSIFPLMTEGGAFTTATGISCPSVWRGSAQQFRTFTTAEERSVAWLNEDDQLSYSLAFAGTTVSASALGFVSQPMGMAVNYVQRPNRTQYTWSEPSGFIVVQTNSTLNTSTNAQEAKKSLLLFGQGQTGAPYCLGLDPCSQYVKVTQPTAGGTVNWSWRGGVRDLSTDINSAHIVAPTSTTRQIISAGWDNDRDQWIFITADSVNDMGFISFDADFAESLDQTEFIEDHWNDYAAVTATAGFTTNPTGAFIANRGMTNELDGFLLGGIFDDTKPMVNLTSQTFVAPAPFGTIVDMFPNIYLAGTTGRSARVWVDYLLFDGADSLIAVKLTELGLRVTVENVEWFKAKIISKGDLKMTQEEVEEWMDSQHKEYKDMLRSKERQGRLRKRKRQVSAYLDEDLQDSIYGQFIDTEDLRPEEIEKLLKKITEMPPEREEDKEHFEG